MTDESWHPPQEPWAPDETQTQWVQSVPAEGSTEWSPPVVDASEPRWADWDQAPADSVWPPLAATDLSDADATSSASPVASDAETSDRLATGRLASGPRASALLASLANLALLRIVASIACPLLLLVGLSADEHHTDGWHSYLAWALFAVVCALLQLAPVLGRHVGMTDESSWSLAAVGTAGLAAYWVIIVLPGASSNTGFVQTLAVGLAIVALWLSPGRRL